MKFKKLIATGVVAAMACAPLAACGSSSNAVEVNSKGEEITTLTWYYAIDTSTHHDLAWEAINEYLAEEIAVVIDYKPVSWGEYETKTNTIKSSGQDFDIMFQMGQYSNSVDQGIAQSISEYLETAGAEMYAALPESLWKSVTINDNIYGIPTYKDNASAFGMIYNKTVADEAGIVMPESFELSAAGLDELLRYVDTELTATYGENHDFTVSTGVEFLDPIEQHASRAAVSKIDGAAMYQDMADGQVFDVYSHPDTLEYYQITRGWVADGIVPLDAKNVEKDPLKADGTLFSEVVLGYVAFPANGWSDNYETGFIPADLNYMTTGNASFGTNIVGASCENVEAAVKFLNLLNTDAFVANTIRFGLEGDYYNVTEDNRLDFAGTLNSDPSARAYYNWYGWQFGNIFAMSLPAQENDTLFEDIMAVNEGAVVGQHLGFVADTSGIQNELTAVEAVYVEYRDNLDFGMLSDVEGAINEMNTKMKSSGIDVVIAEIQSQVNEWRAENGLEVFEQ